MKRPEGFVIAVLGLIAALAALVVWVLRMPVSLDGPEWEALEDCAQNQKWLYQSLEHHQLEHGELPASAADFRISGFPATMTWKCPVSGRGYVLHLENFGDPAAAVITEQEDAHRTTLMWSLKRLRPRVQTMGDGAIQLFEGGKVMTMVGRKNRTRPAGATPSATGSGEPP